jgi:plastocyanin
MNDLSRRRRTGLALAGSLLAASCALALAHGGPTASAAPAAASMKMTVTIANYSFHPANLTVKRGSTVTWINSDDDVHTIKSTAGPAAFGSPALDGGGRFGFTFQQAGTYHYICSVHPYMHGVIVVR